MIRFVSLTFVTCACALTCSAQPDVKPAPPTAADTARFMKYGRPLPKPELLQPTLDHGLPDFQPSLPPDTAGTLTGAASDVLADIAGRWVKAFQHYYPQVKIAVPPPYSGKVGAKELVSEKVQFALVSRELVPSDVTTFHAKFGYDPLSVPIMGGTFRDFGFLDAIGVFVNEDNPLKQLTFAQLDRLLSTTVVHGGEPIRTWGQLGLTGEWADKPIQVWAVQPWNGFEEFVRERVLSLPGRRGEWRPDLHFGETVFPISPAVAKDRYAIGYAGLAYLTPGVKLLALAKEDGGSYIAPSYEDVARARYPLSRVVYCNFNRAPGQAVSPVLGEFVRFILSREGQQVVLDQAIYLPLRSEQLKASRQLLE